MFKLLVKKQLLELSAFLYQDKGTGRRRSAPLAAAYGLFMALVLAAVMASFGAMAFILCSVMVSAGLDWLYFSLTGLAALAVGTVAGLFCAYGILYSAEDNELLLSLPIPPGRILAARMLSVWLLIGGYAAVMGLPAYIVYFICAAQPAAKLAMLPFLLVVSGASLALACIGGWAAALVSVRVTKYKTALSVLLALTLIALYAYASARLEENIGWLTAHLDGIAAEVQGGARLLWLLGRAGAGEAAALLPLALLTLALLALVWALLRRSYLRIMTTRRSAARAQYRERAARLRSPDAALLEREARRLASSATYILNGALGTAFLLAIAGYALCRADVFRALALLVPVPGAAPALVCAALCAAASTNMLTPSSVSLEGRTLWLLQALPVTPWQALRAKLRLQLLLTWPPLLAAAACLLWALGCGGLQAVLAALTACLYALALAALGLALGLKMPNLNWTSEAAVIKQGAPPMLTLLVGWALLAALCGLWWLAHGAIGASGALAVCAGLLAAGSAGLIARLRTAGSRRFAQLGDGGPQPAGAQCNKKRINKR